MFYAVNNHLNVLYVLSNKAVGPGKKSKINKRRAYFYSGVQSNQSLLTIIKTLKLFKLQCLVPLATTTTLPHQKRTMQTYEHTSIYRHSSYSSTLHTHTHLKHITKSFRKHGKRRKLDSYHELWLPFALPTAKSKKIHSMCYVNSRKSMVCILANRIQKIFKTSSKLGYQKNNSNMFSLLFKFHATWVD